MLTVYNTDALTALAQMPDESAQCCVTSPPYWGLRSYGTDPVVWDATVECEHEWGDSSWSNPNGSGGQGAASVKQHTSAGSNHLDYSMRVVPSNTCAICGAWRGELGLEPTPELYVQHIVQIFREVRRVLKSDGTCFLNLGDSYYGSWGNYAGQNRGAGKQRAITNGSQVPNPSYDGLEKFRPPTAGRAQRARGCDNGGTAGQGSQESDSSSGSLDGEHTNSWWMNISDSDGRHALAQVRESCRQTRACMEALRDHLPIVDYSARRLIQQSLTATLDQVRSALPVVERLRAWLASKPDGFVPQPLECYRPLGMLSAFLSSLRSLASCVQGCVHRLDANAETSDYSEDTALLFAELDDHIQCTGEYCLQTVSWLDYKPQRTTRPEVILKPKDLVGIPWMAAFALRADGWWLRSDIIWSKPAPMPESVTDRPTKSHEYIFLLTKSQKYYYDHEAIKEPCQSGASDIKKMIEKKDRIGGKRKVLVDPLNAANCTTHIGNKRGVGSPNGRNKRSVWTVNTRPFNGSHFATFPPELIVPCILAGCPSGGTVLDVCAGSGTVGKVAIELGRKAVLIEPNPNYCEMIEKRTQTTIGLPM